MYPDDIDQLNRGFSLAKEKQQLCFKPGEGNIPIIEIRNPLATARVSLQGAHLLSWIPVADDNVIWLSDAATFAPGKAVRGGIPVCWPWFGENENHPAFPAHGFARTVLWRVLETRCLDSGATQITFQLDTHRLHDSLQAMWPQHTVVEYRITVGQSLTLELTTFNHSDQPIIIGQALHTYFNVGDVRKTTLSGLEAKTYLDKTAGFKRKTQTGPVSIASEVDRVYLQSADDVVIDNQRRKIIVKKQGSRSTVVWNPWKDGAEKMGDLGKDGYLKMLCVETANAAEDTISIMPGEYHCLKAIYLLDQA